MGVDDDGTGRRLLLINDGVVSVSLAPGRHTIGKGAICEEQRVRMLTTGYGNKSTGPTAHADEECKAQERCTLQYTAGEAREFGLWKQESNPEPESLAGHSPVRASEGPGF